MAESIQKAESYLQATSAPSAALALKEHKQTALRVGVC